MKQCTNCKAIKSLSEFYTRYGKPETRCKDCIKAKVKERYDNKREEILEGLSNLKHTNPDRYYREKDAKRRRRTELAKKLKSKPCADCGGSFHFAAMDFDHKNPEEKGYNGNGGRSLLSLSEAKILEEVEKCDLVCANCHRVRTYNREQKRINEEKQPTI